MKYMTENNIRKATRNIMKKGFDFYKSEQIAIELFFNAKEEGKSIDEMLKKNVSEVLTNDNVKQYILDNWNKYDTVDTKDDMLALLNILEAHGETLDSLHDVAFNGYKEFCYIVGRFENDRDTANALFEFNTFYKNPEEFFQTMKENAKDDGISYKEYMEFEHYKYTTDGLVHIVFY